MLKLKLHPLEFVSYSEWRRNTTTTTTITTECKLFVFMYRICASAWKVKHHQCKFQKAMLPDVQAEYLYQPCK